MILPIIIIILSTIFWMIVSAFKRDLKYVKNHNIGTIYVCLFLVHSGITIYSLQMLGCREMEEGRKWLTADYSIECWTEEHTMYALSYALPSLIVWGLGIPFVSMILVFKHRNQLKEFTTKLKFSYFFNGFHEKYYLWEFVILFRKIMVIGIVIMLANFSFTIQILTAFALMFTFVIIQIIYMPFQSKELNNLELMSVTVTCIILHLALFYSTELDSSNAASIILLLILLSTNT